MDWKQYEEFLDAKIFPLLKEGLEETFKVKPTEYNKYLGNWLVANNSECPIEINNK